MTPYKTPAALRRALKDRLLALVRLQMFLGSLLIPLGEKLAGSTRHALISLPLL
jgi:hypothetical protein